MNVPVTHSDEGETRNNKVESICAGSQILFLGNPRLISPIPSSIPSNISEEKQPGAMQFAFMLYLAHSVARASVYLTTLAFVIE